MGHAIEEIALERGHEVVLKINIDNTDDFTEQNLRYADVAIEFTGPESAFENVMKCLDAGVATVCGSTGWLADYEKVVEVCNKMHGSFLYASNFSVGVNLFFELNIFLAKLMERQKDYNVILEEIHHTQKKDAPSGTAITLAEQVLEVITSKKHWVNHLSDNLEELEIISERTGNVPGTHTVKYFSAVDDIEIIHTAHNRKGFAMGAVLAAEFICSKKGIFSMKDVLGL